MQSAYPGTDNERKRLDWEVEGEQEGRKGKDNKTEKQLMFLNAGEVNPAMEEMNSTDKRASNLSVSPLIGARTGLITQDSERICLENRFFPALKERPQVVAKRMDE